MLGQSQTYYMSSLMEDTIPTGVLEKKAAHENGCTVFDFNEHNGMVATGGNDGFVRVWDTKGGFDSKNYKLMNC